MERQTHGAGRDSAGLSHNNSRRVTTMLITSFFASLRDSVGGKGEGANIDDSCGNNLERQTCVAIVRMDT